MPQAIEKRCRVCGADVSRRKRTKDQSGNYYCTGCYAAATASQQTPAQTDLDGLEHLAAAEAAAAPQSLDRFDCPSCGGMFAFAKMHPTGVCNACVSASGARKSKSPRSGGRGKLRLFIAIAAGVLLIGGIAKFLTLKSRWNDIDEANKRIAAGNDKLVAAAEQRLAEAKAAAAPTVQPERQVVAPVQQTRTRGELVDDDPILSNIAARSGELSDALRGDVGARLGYSYMNLARNGNVISDDEFRYAQSFRKAQGDFP